MTESFVNYLDTEAGREGLILVFLSKSLQQILLDQIDVHLFDDSDVDFVAAGVVDERSFFDGHQTSSVNPVQFNRSLKYTKQN